MNREKQRNARNYNLIDKLKINQSNLEVESCKIARKIDFKKIANEKIRSEKIAKLSSKIASFPSLRKILNYKQIEFAKCNKKEYGGWRLDGRDRGTKILHN